MSRLEDRDTISLISLAHMMVSRQVSEGVARAGHPIRPSHSAVFGQLDEHGVRVTELARGANMTPQAMSELIDELERLGYVVREPDPSDRRAKLIMLTPLGREASRVGRATVASLERRIVEILGVRGHEQLRRMLLALLKAGGNPT